MVQNMKKESGQASRLLLVLAIIILVAAIIVYLVIKMAERPASPTPVTPVEQPIYEQTLGNIKFIFEGAREYGDTLYARNALDPDNRDEDNITTTERFIEVKVGAKNMGRINLEDGTWDMENIVDSEGREFVPLDRRLVDIWLPKDDLCGTLLKPAFNPTPCIKIYEVSRESTGLKIRVITGKDNSDNLDKNDAQKALLDLIVTK